MFDKIKSEIEIGSCILSLGSDHDIPEHEFEVSQRAASTEAVKALVVMTPGQADGAKQPALAAPAKKVEEDIPEPIKRASKKDEDAPTPKKKLADVVAAWSDED